MNAAERAAILADLADDSWLARKRSETQWRISLFTRRTQLKRALEAIGAAEAERDSLRYQVAAARGALDEYRDGYVGSDLAASTLAGLDAHAGSQPPQCAEAPPGDGVAVTLTAILAGEPATDDDYRDAAQYPLLPPGQLDDGQILAAAALERVRQAGTQPSSSPQTTDTNTGDS